VDVHLDLRARQFVELVPGPGLFLLHFAPYAEIPGGGIEMRNRSISGPELEGMPAQVASFLRIRSSSLRDRFRENMLISSENYINLTREICSRYARDKKDCPQLSSRPPAPS
jgi:hypothetical protein